MDSSFVVKPRAGTYASRDPVPVRQATATELEASKAVSAAGDGGGKHGGGTGHQHDQRQDQRHDHAVPEIVVDPESREMIYRERDVRAADREHPDQALLRLRAYRQAPTADEPAPSRAHADIET